MAVGTIRSQRKPQKTPERVLEAVGNPLSFYNDVMIHT